jgi:hypothetical protein
MIRRLMLITAVLGLSFTAGCKHKCCLNDRGRRPQPYLPTAPNSPYLLPPAGLPTTPAPFSPPPGIDSGSVVPPVGPTDLRQYGPIPGPAKPAPEILLPDPIPGGSSSRSASPGVLGTPVKPQTAEPKTAEASSAPVGLPGYTRVKQGVASGRRPTLDGLDSLKQAGFRSMVYLHKSDADLSAMKDVISKRDMAFLAIEATPDNLARAIEQFNAVVADTARHPIYVFDEDGVNAGAVWYLHFRTAEAMGDDLARLRARPLGFTDEGDEAKEFSLAIQRYLETR